MFFYVLSNYVKSLWNRYIKSTKRFLIGGFYPSIEFLRDRRFFGTILPSVLKFWKKDPKLYARNAFIVRKFTEIAKQQITRI